MPPTMRRLAALVLVGLLVTAGCVEAVSFGTPTAGEQRRATVTHVVDGDTVEVRFPDGSDDTVRLIGVDSPEVHADTAPAEFEGVPDTAAGRDCLRTWGERASAFATDRLAGQSVTLVFDPNTDRRGAYDRLLAYVRVDGATFNYRLVDRGYARVYDSSFARGERFYDAESRAQDARTGLWTCREPSSRGTPTGEPTPTADNGTGVVVATVRYDAPGNDNDHLAGEYVVLANRGDRARDLAGWTVSDEAGHVYEFGSRTLAAGATVTLHTGSGTDNATHVFWGQDGALWNNDGDTATLRDAGGEVVDRWAY